MPESLAVRGRFEEAIAAYLNAADEEPDDPEPWLRIARIERSDLGRPARAVEALRAARARVEPDSPTAMLASREIAEAWLSDPATAPRAMPELARLAAAFSGTPTAAWASRRLVELKARLAAGEFDGPASATSRAPD
jgi:tetratricopeptide (TPR) repeat protein